MTTDELHKTKLKAEFKIFVDLGKWWGTYGRGMYGPLKARSRLT